MMSGMPRLRLLSLVLAVPCAVTAVLPVRAHHSQGMYDISTWTTLEGTIRQVRWSNPHMWVFVDVEDEQGQVQTWALDEDGRRVRYEERYAPLFPKPARSR